MNQITSALSKKFDCYRDRLLVGDIKDIVNEAIKPVRDDLAEVEKRLTERFNQGFDELKKLITGSRPTPQP